MDLRIGVPSETRGEKPAGSVDIVTAECNQTSPRNEESTILNAVDQPHEQRLAQLRQAVVEKSKYFMHTETMFGQGKWLLENFQQPWQGNLGQWGAPGPYALRERICIGLKLLNLSGKSEAKMLLASFHDKNAGDHVLLSLLTNDEWEMAGIDVNRDIKQPAGHLPILAAPDHSASKQVAAPHSVLSGRYIDNRDGTVTDWITGLMWMRCALGQTWDGSASVGKAQKYTWEEAKSLHMVFAGSSDWRLPDIEELKSIVVASKKAPAIDSTIFPNTPSLGFWSGSPSADNTRSAWSVRFTSGYAIGDHRSVANCVRLVRSGQLPLKNDEAEHRSTRVAISLSRQSINAVTGDEEGSESLPAESVSRTDPPLATSEVALSLAAASSLLRAAIDLLRDHPASFIAERNELRSLLGNEVRVSTVACAGVLPEIQQPVYASLLQLLHGLVELETIALTDLRRHLLPLDLLPSAVIEETNERALDLVGELALEEVGDEIVVVREVLVAVLANWQGSSASEGIEP